MKKSKMMAPAAAISSVVVALMMPTAAHAAPGSPAEPSAATVASEHGVTIAESGFAPLTTEYVEGGEWRYGTRGTGAVWRKEIYSDFWHKTRKHGSSVKDGNNNLRRSADTAKNQWSRVAFAATANGNKAFYRFVS